MHLQRPRAALLLAALVLAACGEAGVEQPGPLTGPPAATDGNGTPSPAVTVQPRVDELEGRIRTRINTIRQEHGLQPLEPRAEVAAVARNYSQRMLREDFFSHVAPGGGDVADRLREAGIQFRAVGENLFKSVGATDIVEQAVQGWMNSPGHRQIILSEQFTQTGVGVALENGTFYATQIFLRPP